MSRSYAIASGIVSVEPEELLVRVRAGTAMSDLMSELATKNQRLRLPMLGTVGGAVAARRNGPYAADNRGLPNIALMLTAVDGTGRTFRAGGTTVKNASGFDMVKVLVGSRGTLATITEVLFRTEPIPAVSRWFLCSGSTNVLYRPTLDISAYGRRLVNIEGHLLDVQEQSSLLSDVDEIARPTDEELCRLAPPELTTTDLDPAAREICRRLKASFDPHNKLSPELSIRMGLVI